MSAATQDLTALAADAVQEAGKVQGRFDLLIELMGAFDGNDIVCGWAEGQLISLREKNREVYSILRMVE